MSLVSQVSWLSWTSKDPNPSCMYTWGVADKLLDSAKTASLTQARHWTTGKGISCSWTRRIEPKTIPELAERGMCFFTAGNISLFIKKDVSEVFLKISHWFIHASFTKSIYLNKLFKHSTSTRWLKRNLNLKMQGGLILWEKCVPEDLT